MEQQTPIPPQIKDEAARRAKTRHFSTLDLGWRRGGGGSRFSIYFVQDCSYCWGIFQWPDILKFSLENKLTSSIFTFLFKCFSF